MINPEQLAKWKEESEFAYAGMSFTHGFDDGAKCYEAGYLRAKQESFAELAKAKNLQPITADMVTDEMIFAYSPTAEGYQKNKPFAIKSLLAAAYKRLIAAAVNAWIKHRGDTT